jgi:hypothetical protein
VEQDAEIDSNVDVDVEIRDDLDADVAADVGSYVDALTLALVEIGEEDDGASLYAGFDDYANANGDVDLFIDVADITES